MKYLFSLVLLVGLRCPCYSQVLIGASPSAAIEVLDDNKGILLPEVALVSITNPAPLPSHQQGMLVYNTTIGNFLTKGVYYNTGSQWLRMSNNNSPNSSQIEFLTIGNEIRLDGNTGNDALIQKNASPGRDELQIYATGDAYTGNSAGSGIHLYGNSDNEHAGNIAFLTGPSEKGNGRMIISGGGGIGAHSRSNTDTRVTIGNLNPQDSTDNIWNFVDDRDDTAMLNLKNPIGRPAICVFQAGVNEGELAVPDGEAINFGHWSGTTFTSRLEIDSQGRVGIGTIYPNAALEVDGDIRLEDVSSIPSGGPGHTGIYSFNGELYAFDESNNHTVISPHHFSLMQPSEDMAWSYYSKDLKSGKEINVDMLKALRILEELSGEKLVYIKE
jgi:hypothetical protein